MADNLGSLRRFLKTVVRPAIYGRRAPLEVSAHHLHGEPIPAIEAVARPFTPFEVGNPWGGMWDTTWFRFRGSIPDSWAGSEVVALIHLGGDQMVGFTAEGQIWDAGLRPVQGLHHRHREFVLARRGSRGRAGRVLRRGGCESDPTVGLGRLAPAPARLPGGTALHPRDSGAGGRRPVRRRALPRHAGPGRTGRTGLRPIRGDHRGAGQGTGHHRPGERLRLGRSRPGTCWLRCSTSPRPRRTPSWRWVTPTSTAPGCGRYARPDANAQGRSPTSCACSSVTPSTTSCAARPCSTSG